MTFGNVPRCVILRGHQPRFGPRLVRRGRDVLVLRAAHQPQERAEVPRRVAERPEAVQRQAPQPLAQEDDLLGPGEHAELGPEADLQRRLAQDAVAEGVERADARLGIAVGDELVDALGHLHRRLLGEGEGQHFLRARALGRDEVRDAAGEDGRLARARARDDQQRTGDMRPRGIGEAVFDRCSLAIVKRAQMCRTIHA